MHPRDLFNIIIKVFGLFVIRDIFMTFPYLISPLLAIISGERYETVIWNLAFSTLLLGFYFFIAYMFIFRTTSIVNFLKLEQDFLDEPVTLNISTKNVVVISLVLLSGYILIEEIPIFCNAAFDYYQMIQVRFPASKPSIAKLLISGVKILLAFLIIGERSRIIQLVLKTNPTKGDEQN